MRRYYCIFAKKLKNKGMKKLFLTLIVAFFTITGGIAQNVTVEEPEFAEETLLLTSNNQGVKLSRENGTVKTKAGASLYLTGIGKVKSRLTLKGVKSTSKAVGGSTTRLIVKAADNKTDPNSFISIFKFEVKGKERRYQLAEAGTLSKSESNNLSSVDYKAKKYGESSYYIVFIIAKTKCAFFQNEMCIFCIFSRFPSSFLMGF